MSDDPPDKPPLRKPFVAPPEPIRPVGRGSGNWRKKPVLFQRPAIRYSFMYDISSYPIEHRNRIAVAEIEAIERGMSQLDGILHMAVPFIAGMREHAIRKNLPADYVITNTEEFVRIAAIGQSIPDRDRQSIRDAVRKLPQYSQAVRDVAAALPSETNDCPCPRLKKYMAEKKEKHPEMTAYLLAKLSIEQGAFALDPKTAQRAIDGKHLREETLEKLAFSLSKLTGTAIQKSDIPTD